jgi:organic radical activating enzyme
MNDNTHRICIIGNPRCGSHYVLDAIKLITGIDSQIVHLDEPFTLDDNVYNTPELIDHALELKLLEIESFRASQGIVFSFFKQDNMRNAPDIIRRLKLRGFKFLVLKRNLIDQLLSYAIAYESDLWVKVKTTNDVQHGLNVQGTMPEVSISQLTQEAVSFLYNKLVVFDEFISSLDIEYTEITYETAMNDLAKYFNKGLLPYDGKHLKQISGDPYNLIKNKDEVKTFMQDLVSGNYEINQILKKSKSRRKGRSNIKDTICRFAWDYSVLNLARNELRACCRTVQTKVSDEDFKRGTDIFTGFIPIIEIRKALLRGEKHDHCEACWAIEDKADPVVKEKGFINSARSGFDDFVNYVYSLRNYPETNTMNFWADKTKEEIAYQLQHITEADIDKFIRIDHHYLIELNLGNTCDLKCVYCNHHYSSQWAAEKLKYKEITINEIETELPKIKDTVFEDIFWKWFYERKAFDADAINFIGGEPLIIEKFYAYTDRIIKFYETDEKRKRFLELGVVSNFNTPSKQYARFKDTCFNIITSEKINLDFNVSCESIGNRAEFIRTGTNWKLMVENIEDFLQFLDAFDNNEYHRIFFNLQIAMNSLCVSDLPAFFTFFCALNKKYNHNIHFRPNHIVWPAWMNPDILPVEYVKYIDMSVKIIRQHMTDGDLDLKNYSKYGKWAEYLGFLHSIKTGIENPNKDLDARKHFAYNIDKLCTRRNLNFHTTFPEMIPFYNECKELLLGDSNFVPAKF